MKLEWLIHPLSVHDFVHDYLEKKPLIIKRGIAHYYDALLTVDAIDHILRRGQITGRIEVLMLKASGKIYPSQFLQSKVEQNVSIRTGFDFEKMQHLFEVDKATLLINGSMHEWKPIRELSANVSQTLRTRAGANVFVTPAHAQCFPVHFDEHDLFIIQISGKKRWRVYENATYLPLEPQNSNTFDFSTLKLLHELDLEAGDMLYFPRGFVHEVVTTDSISAHVTLGCMNVTWLQVIDDCVRTMVQEDEAFRGAFMADLAMGETTMSTIHSLFKAKLEQYLTLERLEQVAEKYRFHPPYENRFHLHKPQMAAQHS